MTIDLTDSRTPTWPELELDACGRRLKWSLVAYFVTLVLFWAHVLGEARYLDAILMPFLLAALLNYIVLVALAYKIQQTLHESGLYKHGGWHVWIGAFLLNPVLLGWFIPVSVLVNAGAIRRRLEARWPHGRTEQPS